MMRTVMGAPIYELGISLYATKTWMAFRTILACACGEVSLCPINGNFQAHFIVFCFVIFHRIRSENINEIP